MSIRVETWNIGKWCKLTCSRIVDVYPLIFGSNPERTWRQLGYHSWYACFQFTLCCTWLEMVELGLLVG